MSLNRFWRAHHDLQLSIAKAIQRIVKTSQHCLVTKYREIRNVSGSYPWRTKFDLPPPYIAMCTLVNIKYGDRPDRHDYKLEILGVLPESESCDELGNNVTCVYCADIIRAFNAAWVIQL